MKDVVNQPFLPIPDNIVEILLHKIKKCGRTMFYNFFTAVTMFLGVYYFGEVFSLELRIFLSFLISMLFLLPFLGSYFERRNILNDLENGKMMYVSNIQEEDCGYLCNGIYYEKINFLNYDNGNSGYVLVNSKIILKVC